MVFFLANKYKVFFNYVKGSFSGLAQNVAVRPQIYHTSFFIFILTAFAVLKCENWRSLKNVVIFSPINKNVIKICSLNGNIKLKINLI